MLYLEYIQFVSVKYTSIRLGNKVKEKKEEMFRNHSIFCR